ncbi:MAG: radical SAM protein [Clostridia bacterium]|nr:radical SAM protein [Clostridia bacterium]
MGKINQVFILTSKEFSVLIQADGMHDIEESVTTDTLLARGMLLRCEKGERSLLPAQDYMLCDNYFMEIALIEITFRCNMKCRHCFIYSDNTSNQQEMSVRDFDKLLDSIYQCGIKKIALTGGEPLLHREFPRILDLISEHHMSLAEIFTNGILLNDTLLDRIIDHGYSPECHISFDGLGYHDSLRGVPGSEKKTLAAIKKCIDKQLIVSVNVNINEDNKNVILETLELLDEMGVSDAMLIRTSESPRWVANQGKSMVIEDYYDFLIDLLKEYTSKPRYMHIRIAQLLRMNVREKTFALATISGCVGSCVNAPVCNDARHMLTIGVTGNLYPCPEISGVMDMMEIKYENILEQPLQQVLHEGQYADWMSKKSQERIQHSNKCRICKYREICLGGCPAISCVTPDHYGDFWGYNPWQCAFFEGNYTAKFINALSGYKCTNPGIDAIIKLSESQM